MGNLADEFRLSPAQAACAAEAKLAREAELAAEKKAGKKTRLPQTRKKDRRRMDYFPVDTNRLERMVLEVRDVRTPLLILTHLEERWWKQFGRNPVELPAFQVGDTWIAKDTKARGLAILENFGFVRVERRFKKSPLVTLTWREVTKYPG